MESHEEGSDGDGGDALSVDGWLNPSEAAYMRLLVESVDPSVESPLVVEIGSYKGRSTLVWAGALRTRGGGTVIAIDPFDRDPGQFEDFQANIRRGGVERLVKPLRCRSREAAEEISTGSAHILFVDGSHDYDDVVDDIRLYLPKLAPGAAVAFNDPFWPGVGRALRDVEGNRGSSLRNPRWVDNTVFFEFRPHEAWRLRDGVRLARLRVYLRTGRTWLRFHQWLCTRSWIPLWLRRAQLRSARLLLAVLLPRGAPPSPIR